MSTMSVEEIKNRRDSFDRWMEIGGVLGRGYPRPIISVTVTLGNYQHLGQQGILTIRFFLGRLQNTTFYPLDMGAYKRLLKVHGIDLEQNKEVTLPPSTRVLQGVAEEGLYRGKDFICWSDTRLDEEERKGNSLLGSIGAWVKKRLGF
ncbi:MAG: hypothetical protein ACREQA_15345 [Candidatus Binatia bacterium]